MKNPASARRQGQPGTPPGPIVIIYKCSVLCGSEVSDTMLNSTSECKISANTPAGEVLFSVASSDLYGPGDTNVLTRLTLFQETLLGSCLDT